MADSSTSLRFAQNDNIFYYQVHIKMMKGRTVSITIHACLFLWGENLSGVINFTSLNSTQKQTKHISQIFFRMIAV